MKYFLHHDDLPKEVCIGSSIAVDTETTGLNLVRDRLCLIQICTESNEIHLIKITKNSNSPVIFNILCNNKILKIFHFARADMGFIKKYLGVDVQNVNCTKIMSKIARSYTDRHGLKDLTKEFIGIEISKQQQSTDFGGNLTEKQLKYCATDVIYLHEIASKLKKILVREKRLDLYDKAIKCIYTRVDLDLAFFTEDIWSH